MDKTVDLSHSLARSLRGADLSRSLSGVEANNRFGSGLRLRSANERLRSASGRFGSQISIANHGEPS
jgi:hypothetical protein